MSNVSVSVGLRARALGVACVFVVAMLGSAVSVANPWNGKVVFQAFWWDLNNENYPGNWYTYLAKLAPKLRDIGFDGMWIPAPSKGRSGGFSMGYDPFDHYDLGDKDQKGTVATKFGTKDQLLRMIAVAHANGLEIYPDIVLNHMKADEHGQQKTFRYMGFAGPDTGRWPKDPQHFHPNSDHRCDTGNICGDPFGFGPDACYRDASNGGGANGKYMRDQAREWFVWLTKQLDADGYRFDAVKHFPAYVVEDVLFNAKRDDNEFFCADEFVPDHGPPDLDIWVSFTKERCGTFDFPFREALFKIVSSGGFFDIGSLPNFQQSKRLKTVPFVNNHDSFRGPFHDSDISLELLPTINPDDSRADVAYAAAFAVDGSPLVFYEDLIVNSGDDRFKADPENLQMRDYLINLIWAHQKLNFKDGAYKVPFQGSPDLLVLERTGKALIALNDNGIETLNASVQTSFGPNVTLHDYSGSNAQDITTDAEGRVTVSVPKMSYAVWGRPEYLAVSARRSAERRMSSNLMTISATPAPMRSGTVAG